MQVPTVKIKFPANLRHGYAIINESDFDPAIHELLDPDPLDHDADGKKGGALRDDGPTVAEYVEAGYQAANYPPAGYASRSTPEEIEAAIAAQEKPAQVEIPADWAELHHTKQIALAKALAGADIVPDAGQTVTEAAREIIAVAVAERAAA